jgi:hypothetical protein
LLAFFAFPLCPNRLIAIVASFTSMSYLKTITRANAGNALNLGGIVSVYVVRKRDVIAMARPSLGTIYGAITFEAGKGWIKWDMTIESAVLSSTDARSREGAYQVNELQFKIPKDIPGVRDMFEQASQDEFIVLIKDSQSKNKIFGHLDKPVRFAFGHSTGSTLAEGNFYQCKFYYEGPDNVFHYDGSIAIAPPGFVPALVKFKGSGRPDSEAIVIGQLQPGETLMIESDFGFTHFYIIP